MALLLRFFYFIMYNIQDFTFNMNAGIYCVGKNIG